MKLTTLKIQNFKGIREKEINAPNGSSINILGRNAAGKSTIGDSITYLLFNKDMQGRSPQSFEIKTRDENGDVIQNLEHTVEATFCEPNITLKKVYKEKWKNIRAVEKRLDGHSTEHFIDDELVKKGDYEDRIAEIMSEDLFKMLTIPNHFAEQLHWSDRRKMLTEIAGEISDQDIIDSDPELEDYDDVLDGKTAESRKGMLERERKIALERIDEIPALIRENQDKITTVETDGVDEKITGLKEKKSGLEEELAKARSGGGVYHLQVKIEELEAEKQKIISSHGSQYDDKIADARAVYRKKMEAEDEALDKVREQNKVVDEKLEQVNFTSHQIETIKEAITTQESEQPEPKKSGSSLDECPMCGQDMPKDSDSDDHYDEYLKEFNEKKAEELKSLAEDLDAAQSVLEGRQKEYDKANKELAKLEKAHEKAKKEAKDAESDLDNLKSSIPDTKESKEYKALTEKQEALEGKVDEIRMNNSKQIQEIQQSIENVETEITNLNEVTFQARKNQEIKERIEELKAEQKEQAKIAQDADRGLYLIQRFEIAKAEVVTQRVNEMFDIVTWKMHEPMMNGGLNNNMCEAIVDGVPYTGGLNNARRVQAGLDIINTLGKHFGAQAPVVIDNAESVTSLNTYGLQVIALYVSKEHKELTVTPQKSDK